MPTYSRNNFAQAPTPVSTSRIPCNQHQPTLNQHSEHGVDQWCSFSLSSLRIHAGSLSVDIRLARFRHTELVFESLFPCRFDDNHLHRPTTHVSLSLSLHSRLYHSPTPTSTSLTDTKAVIHCGPDRQCSFFPVLFVPTRVFLRNNSPFTLYRFSEPSF